MDRNRGSRVTVQQAAATLGVTEQAIRKRIKRGSIDFDKDEDGRVYVYLREGKRVTDTSSDDVPNPHTDALISEMQARIISLERSLGAERDANRENRRLLAAALERRALDPYQPSEDRSGEPPEPSGGAEYPETDTEPESAGFDTSQRTDHRSWWRRMFGR